MTDTESNSKYFIGREDSLAKIDEAKQKNIALVTIQGKGGIGKTTLLNKYRQKLTNTSLPPIVLQFDFDDYRYKTAFDIRLAVVNKLGREHFEQYLFKRNLLGLQSPTTPRATLRQFHKEIAYLWKKSFEKQAKKKNKIIFLFDTLDVLTDDELNDLIRFFFSKPLAYTFIAIAGRDDSINLFTEKLKALWLDTEFKEIHKKIYLKPFTKSDALHYFSLKSEDYGRKLPWEKDSATEKAIHKLTEGTPILVDLFMTVLLDQRDHDFLKWIKQKNNAHHSGLLNEDDFKCQFKQQLISRFSRNYKIHELVPLLAHVWPINQEMLADLMNIELDKAAQLMNEAQNASFIKTLPDPMQTHDLSGIKKSTGFMVTLHDIMRDIMLEYGWENLDSEKETRKDYSERFLQIAENILNEVNQHIRQHHSKNTNNNATCTQDAHSLYLLKNNINEKRLQHQLFLNPEEGTALFINLFDKTYGKIRHDESHHIQQLFEKIGYTIEKDSPSKTNYFKKIDKEKSKNIIVGYLIKEIQFWGGRNLSRAKDADNYINKLDLPEELSIDIKDELVEYKIRNGQFQEALTSIDEGIEYCEKNITSDNKKLYQQWFKLLNISGWIYRLIGDIEKSDNAYAQAQELPAKHSLRLGIDISQLDMAYLLLNMSYVKALLRQYDVAVSLSKQAQNLFKAANYPRGAWMVESARGRIEIEFDHFNDARRYFEKTLESFSDDDKEWRSKIFLGIAHAFWLERVCSDTSKETKKILLTKAKHALTNAEQQEMPIDRAELFHLKANIAFSEKDFKKATQYYKKCEEESNKMHALYYQARAISGLLKVAARQGNVATLPKLQTKFNTFLKKNNAENKDSLSLALFKRYEGDLYLLSGKQDKAIKLYKKALPIIAQYGRYTPSNLKGQMKSLTYFFTSFIKGKYPSNNSEQKRRKIVISIGRELLHFWLTCPCDENGKSKETQTYSRLYPDAYQIISQWIDGEPSQWDHSDEY